MQGPRRNFAPLLLRKTCCFSRDHCGSSKDLSQGGANQKKLDTAHDCLGLFAKLARESFSTVPHEEFDTIVLNLQRRWDDTEQNLLIASGKREMTASEKKDLESSIERNIADSVRELNTHMNRVPEDVRAMLPSYYLQQACENLYVRTSIATKLAVSEEGG